MFHTAAYGTIVCPIGHPPIDVSPISRGDLFDGLPVSAVNQGSRMPLIMKKELTPCHARRYNLSSVTRTPVWASRLTSFLASGKVKTGCSVTIGAAADEKCRNGIEILVQYHIYGVARGYRNL